MAQKKLIFAASRFCYIFKITENHIRNDAFKNEMNQIEPNTKTLIHTFKM